MGKTDFFSQHSTLNHQLFCDADVLRFGEKAERFVAAFAADAALFHSAKRDAQIAHEPAVYPDGAGVNSLRDAMGATQILRPDARGEAVFGVVRVADHFFFVVERRDGDDRAEDFFAIGAAGDRQSGDDGWRKEITVAAAIVDRFRRLAAKRDLAAFFLREIDIELHLVELRLAHDRALLGFVVERIANFQLRRFVDEAVDEIVVGRALDENAGTAQDKPGPDSRTKSARCRRWRRRDRHRRR